MSESIEQDLTPPQNVEIPDQLPLLPVRDIVVFPYMVLPLFVGREMSIKAIEAALAGNRMIFLATQKALDVENPTPDDIHAIGTVGIIMRMLKLPDERIKILVQGLSKAKISGYIQTDPYYSVRIEKINETKAASSTLESEAVMRTVKEQIERIVSLGKVLIPDVMVVIENLEDPGRLADMIASNLGLKVEVTQSVLKSRSRSSVYGRSARSWRRKSKSSRCSRKFRPRPRARWTRPSANIFCASSSRRFKRNSANWTNGPRKSRNSASASKTPRCPKRC